VGQSRARSGIGKALGVAAVLLLVALIAFGAKLLSAGPVGGTSAAKPRVVTEKSAKQVDEALKLLDSKAYDDAHKKLLEIPEDARPTDDANFKKVEQAWAEWKFQQVTDAADSSAKKTILKEIASTDTVDAKQRTRAADMIREIEAKEPPPVDSAIPRVMGPLVPGMALSAKAADSAPTTPTGPVPGPPNEDQLRRSLESKVWSGRGSVDDIRMLKMICSHSGDRVCRNRASDMLKKKLEQ
jgi:hypothetical protein